MKKGECKLPAAKMVIIELEPSNIRKWSRQIREHDVEIFLKSVSKRACMPQARRLPGYLIKAT